MEFFILKDGKQQGPYTPEALKALGVSSETLVWREGMKQWTPAWQVAELKGMTGGNARETAAPQPAPQAEEPLPDDGTEYVDASATTKQCGAKRHRRGVIWLAIAALVFFILLITCPGEEKHRAAITKEITIALTKTAAEKGKANETLGVLSEMFGSAIVKQVVNAMTWQFVEVDNYFIFSIGKAEYGGKEETVSFGILGRVYTFDSDDLYKIIERKTTLPDTMAL